MQTFLTIMSGVIVGVLVFVCSEYLKEIWLEPLQDYKKLKQKISFSLVLYANLYMNPIYYENTSEIPETYINASNEMRILAAETTGFAEIIYKFHFGIPNKNKLLNAPKYFIGISNSFFSPSKSSALAEANREYVTKIQKILKIVKLS